MARIFLPRFLRCEFYEILKNRSRWVANRNVESKSSRIAILLPFWYWIWGDLWTGNGSAIECQRWTIARKELIAALNFISIHQMISNELAMLENGIALNSSLGDVLWSGTLIRLILLLFLIELELKRRKIHSLCLPNQWADWLIEIMLFYINLIKNFQIFLRLLKKNFSYNYER